MFKQPNFINGFKIIYSSNDFLIVPADIDIENNSLFENTIILGEDEKIIELIQFRKDNKCLKVKIITDRNEIIWTLGTTEYYFIDYFIKDDENGINLEKLTLKSGYNFIIDTIDCEKNTVDLTPRETDSPTS